MQLFQIRVIAGGMVFYSAPITKRAMQNTCNKLISSKITSFEAEEIALPFAQKMLVWLVEFWTSKRARTGGNTLLEAQARSEGYSELLREIKVK